MTAACSDGAIDSYSCWLDGICYLFPVPSCRVTKVTWRFETGELTISYWEAATPPIRLVNPEPGLNVP